MTEIFPIVPAQARALWFLGGIAVLMVALTALFAFLAYSCRYTQFEVSPGGLRIRGDLYGRSIPAQSLIVDEARRLDWQREPDYRSRRRSNGTGLPGYLAGWFKLSNREKALLFVTDPGRVVYIPTREGYSVLLSVDDPERFLRSLRQARGAH